jgi:hypothetical protein
MRRAAASCLALALGACSEPLELADWTIPVAEGTPILEYEVVPLEARGGDRIELVRDLVIGANAGDGVDGFDGLYGARDLVVDPEGRMFVLEGGNHRVTVFDAEGSLRGSFGRQGQGPGEFAGPDGIALVGDSIVVNDLFAGRLSVWGLEGDHLEDHAHGRRFRPDVVRGSARSTLIAALGEEPEAGSSRGSVGNQSQSGEPEVPFPRNVTAEYTLAGEQIARISDVPIRGRVEILPGPNVSDAFAEGYNRVDIDVAIGDDQPRFAIARDGGLYLAAGDEYQVLALRPSGEPRWALRASLPMPPFPIAEIDRRVRNNDRVSSRSDFTWDELLPAIDAIRVDGHGHLWLYPKDERVVAGGPGEGAPAGKLERQAPPAPRPVDVYSSEGELLYSGTTDLPLWHVSLGDFMYTPTTEPASGEQVVTRYRVVEPFEE